MQKTNYLQHVLLAIGLSLLLFTSYAQSSRKLTLTRSMPVTRIGNEELQSYKGTDISEVIKSLPDVHIDMSQESSINLRGLGTARTLVLLNGKRMPVYAQSVNYDLNDIPLNAIERVEVLKDGGGAVYGSDAVSGVVNIITKKDMAERLTAQNTYNPYYAVPNIDYSGAQNNQYMIWTGEVKDIYSALPGSSTLSNSTYGDGGKLQIDLQTQSDFRVQELKFLDNVGNIRQTTRYEWYPENYRYGETTYFDCDGNPLHYYSGFTDINGYNFELTQRGYKNSQPVVEYRNVWPGENGDRLRINLTPDRVPVNVFNNNWSRYNFVAPTAGCKTSSSISCDRNILYAGFSMVFEDFGSGVERLKMPGGFINYTRMFSENVGATGHISYNSGSRFMIDYTKLNFLAGVSYTPFERANCGDNFIFTTQALVGIVDQGQKYGNQKFSDTYFTGMLGATEAFQFSDNVGVRVSEHYTPTFAKGNTAHNFTVGVGLRLTF
jgi:outer membrane receptor protein involved in Fe transport